MNSALHVINSLSPDHGGTSVSVPALLVATAGTGRYNNRIIHMDRGQWPSQIGPNSLALTSNHIYINMAGGGRIDDEVRRTDVVQIHELWQAHCITTGVLARRRRKPLVVSAHGMLEPWALRNKFWKKRIYSFLVERPNLQRAALLRALTTAEAADYRRFGLTNPITVIPNGVPPNAGVSPDMFLSSWPELQGKRIILFLSRIHYKKGIDLLVKVWARVAPEFSDAHLVITGPDSEATLPSIEQLVNSLALSDHVTFTGPLYGDIKSSLLNAAALFVLPSHSEGFSVAVLESLAAGVPVIITRGCNFPEVAKSGSGWVVDPTCMDIERALREALNSSDSELHSRGQRGATLVQTTYTWAQIGKQMADVYDWLLGGPRPDTVELWD